jgi:membrane protein YqaA with SNARE-associated domain
VEGVDGAGALLEHPVRILALNASNMHLLATGFQVDWIWFLTVPLLRLLAPDPLFYALGYLYRHRARAWVESMFPGTDRFFELMDGTTETRTMARTVLEAMVVIAPNNPVCAIAGIMAMPIRRFVVLNIIGTIGRLVLFKLISQAYQDQISEVIGWIARYQNYFLYAALALFVVNVVLSGRKLASASDGNFRRGE